MQCLAPIPETGWPGAESPVAGVTGGLLCGHLKHRASLFLEAAPSPCYRGDRSTFAGQMEGLLGHFCLLGVPVVAVAVAARFCPLAFQWSSRGPAQ